MEKDFKYITGIKGILAIIIILHHSINLIGSDNLIVKLLEKEGFLSVEFFFAIGGFLFAVRYYNKIVVGQYTLGEFTKKRFKRLYPNYFINLLVTVVILLLFNWVLKENNNINIYHFIYNILMLGGGVFYPENSYLCAFNRVAWYLTPLLVCNVIAYTVCKLPQKRYVNYSAIVLILLGLFIMEHGWMYPIINPTMARGYVGFFIGLMIGLDLEELSFICKKRYVRIASWLGIMLFIWALFTFNGSIIGITDLLAIPSLAIVLCSYAKIRTFFSLRPLCVIGDYSYSLYLWHFTVLELLHRICDHCLPHKPFQSINVLAIYCVCVVLVAIIFNELSNKLAKRYFL